MIAVWLGHSSRSGKHRVCDDVCVYQRFWLFPCRQGLRFLSPSIFFVFVSLCLLLMSVMIFFSFYPIFLAHTIDCAVSFVFHWSISNSVSFSLFRATPVFSIPATFAGNRSSRAFCYLGSPLCIASLKNAVQQKYLPMALKTLKGSISFEEQHCKWYVLRLFAK